MGGEELFQGLQRWVDRCNTGSIDGFIPLQVPGSGQPVGYVSEETARLLSSRDAGKGNPPAFTMNGSMLTTNPDLASLDERSVSVAQKLAQLHDDGYIDGWRDELYPAVSRFGENPVLLVERAAAPLLGVRAYGVHMNGYVRKPDGSLHLWVATRSKQKPTWPGQLDHIAAGGQPHGLGVLDNMEKEAAEEAGIPPELAQNAVAAGAVSYSASYTYKSGTRGLKRDVLFVFDLELPEEFVPAAVDGEVDSFQLVDVKEVMDIVAFTDKYKDNCNLVTIDFFFRHGLLAPGAPGYLELLQGIRKGELM